LFLKRTQTTNVSLQLEGQEDNTAGQEEEEDMEPREGEIKNEEEAILEASQMVKGVQKTTEERKGGSRISLQMSGPGNGNLSS
jgi:hypothetical protein